MSVKNPVNIREWLALDVTQENYNKIRQLWIAHSKAEDARDLDGLIATLSTTCVYELIPTGQRWEGHAGARQFYTSFLTSFPDVHFDLQDIVIGPQGVIEVTMLSGTQHGEWAGIPPQKKFVTVPIVIHFPWNLEEEKFDGERVYFDARAFEEQLR